MADKGDVKAQGNDSAPRLKMPAIIAGMAALALIIALAVKFGPALWGFFVNENGLRRWVEQQGEMAPAAMTLLVVAQIVVAVLPGEPVELASGFLFGFWPGTAICTVGGALGTLLVLGLVRLLGMRVVRLFFSEDALAKVSWLQDSRRLELMMFVVFLIPGTPKDVLTYVAGLTGLPLWRILLITTVGRIPSIVTSTFAAGLASEGKWTASLVALGVAAVLALLGGAVFAWLQRRGEAS